MRDLADHATNRRRIFQFTGAVHLVQAQTLEGRGLHSRTAGSRSHLLDDDGFLCGHDQASTTSAAGLFRLSAPLFPPRAAPLRGEVSDLRPSMVARIML